MRLVETKTYKIDMAEAEKENLCNIADKLEQIASVFKDKEVFYSSYDCDFEMESRKICEVANFLLAIVYNNIEIN